MRSRDLAEVVGEVGVGHHDVLAAGSREAGEIGAAVAAPALEDHPRAGRRRKFRAAVLRGVVDDEHLAADPARQQRLAGGTDALLDVLLLVQARDHDRHQRRRSGDALIGRRLE